MSQKLRKAQYQVQISSSSPVNIQLCVLRVLFFFPLCYKNAALVIFLKPPR